MNHDDVSRFISLAGQTSAKTLTEGTPEQRKLGAQLLLSEVLEYIIRGLGVVPVFQGTEISHPEKLEYRPTQPVDKLEMIDGLADVAYTMYWNALTFGVPLEAAFDLVCKNNLEKFVLLGDWAQGKTKLEKTAWHCERNITWPAEVAEVVVIPIGGSLYAVGKDARGKVRKPSSYESVDLTGLLEA